MIVREQLAKVAISMINPRRPNLTLRDFFLYEQRRESDKRLNSFFKHAIRYLIVSNVILGSFTVFNLYIYPNYIYEKEPVIQQRSNELYPNEV